MTTYDLVFYPIFGVGCAIAVIASFIAAQRSGFVIPGLLLVAGVVAFWAGLFIGSDFGYRAWQSIPDPPEEAFRDTAPLGALLFGWLPGGVFCVFVFGLIRLARHLLSGGKPGSDPAEPGLNPVEPGLNPVEPGLNPVEPGLNPAESGNPYQAPQSRHGG